MRQDYYYKPDPPLTQEELVGWAIMGMQVLPVDYIKVEEIDGQPAFHFMGAEDIQSIRNWLIKEGLKTNEQLPNRAFNIPAIKGDPTPGVRSEKGAN